MIPKKLFLFYFLLTQSSVMLVLIVCRLLHCNRIRIGTIRSRWMIKQKSSTGYGRAGHVEAKVTKTILTPWSIVVKWQTKRRIDRLGRSPELKARCFCLYPSCMLSPVRLVRRAAAAVVSSGLSFVNGSQIIMCV